jgi:hypothetical protein
MTVASRKLKNFLYFMIFSFTICILNFGFALSLRADHTAEAVTEASQNLFPRIFLTTAVCRPGRCRFRAAEKHAEQISRMLYYIRLHA